MIFSAGPAQDPGQVRHLRLGISAAVGVEPLAPVALAQRPDRAEGPLVDRPADRVLHPTAPACRALYRGVHGGEVVDASDQLRAMINQWGSR